MSTNNTSTPMGDWDPLPVLPAGSAEKQERVFTKKERFLVLLSVSLAVLFDRLVLASAPFVDSLFFSAIFWLCCLIGFYAFFWPRLKTNKVLWIVAGFTAALCIWNLLFDYNSDYGAVTALVIPAVLMAHVQFFAGGYKLKEAGNIAVGWILGWVAKPFASIPVFVAAIGSTAGSGKRRALKSVLAGLLIVLPLMLVILPLLAAADSVFGYYLQKLAVDFDLFSLTWHIFVVTMASALLYSFLWEAGFSKKKAASIPETKSSIDVTASCVVLGAVSLVYVLFCVVQFTYLFAGAGLPDGMTYSEYAREGFAQIIAICMVNLLLFGVFLRYTQKHRAVRVLLVLLLAVTAVMLVSSFVRLQLYIGAYGLTWLRLLSAWFIIYLAALLCLCAARMIKEKIPLIAIAAFLLLGWYTVLGYANPDALILRYNLARSGNSQQIWVMGNRSYIYSLSDNGLLALIDSGAERDQILDLAEQRRHSGRSLSSLLCRRKVALLESGGHEAHIEASAGPEVKDTGVSMESAMREVYSYSS